MIKEFVMDDVDYIKRLVTSTAARDRTATLAETKRIVDIVKSISEGYSYDDAVNDIFYGKSGIYDLVWVFVYFWRVIPEHYLYEAYKCALSYAKSGDYSLFFDENDLLNKLHRLNHCDTVSNPAITDKLDVGGYLTIFHGHAKDTMRGSHSWSLSPETAHFFGNRNARYQRKDTYYVVTGKCRPEDIIAYITDREEEEIVILNKDVKDKQKEFYLRPKEA